MNDRRDETTPDGPTSDGGGPWRQVAQRHYDPGDHTDLTAVIVSAIADGRGVRPDEVKSPPLYEVIDTAALEATFFETNGTTATRQGTGTVEFQYEEYRVTVRSDGWVQVYGSRESADTPGGD